MTVNNNVHRIDSQAILDSDYSKEEYTVGQVSIVADSERGNVVRLVRNASDGLVGGSHRTEISRDVFVSEYALSTGGGWIWGSYKLDPEWKAKHHLLLASDPVNVDYSVNIMQWHPRNTDGTIHPKWSIVVNEFGVCLRKWAHSDASGKYEIAAKWPVDSMVWHDVVVYAYWSTGWDGVFAVYLDDRQVYRFNGPTIYDGATAGAYWKSGIYSPGGFPTGIDSLTVYSQGYKQVYPDGDYEDCRGTGVKDLPPVLQSLFSVGAI